MCFCSNLNYKVQWVFPAESKFQNSNLGQKQICVDGAGFEINWILVQNVRGSMWQKRINWVLELDCTVH